MEPFRAARCHSIEMLVKSRSTVRAALVVLAGAWAFGCGADRPALIKGSARPAARIFEGFAYVGQDLPEAHVNRYLPVRLPSQPLPATFAHGHRYFFHHLLPADEGMTIAQEVLAPRLRKEGFALTEGPEGIFFQGFAHFDGGSHSITVWGIQFRRDGCVGTIFYDSDFGIRDNPWPVVRRTWDPADYVLRVEGDCEF